MPHESSPNMGPRSFFVSEVHSGIPRLIYHGEKTYQKIYKNSQKIPFRKHWSFWDFQRLSQFVFSTLTFPWIGFGDVFLETPRKFHPLGPTKHYVTMSNYLKWSLLVFVWSLQKTVGYQKQFWIVRGLERFRDDDDDDDDDDDALLIKALSPGRGGVRLPCYTAVLSNFELLLYS